MIDEREVADLLRAATDDIDVPAGPARDLAAAGSTRRRRRWAVAAWRRPRRWPPSRSRCLWC